MEHALDMNISSEKLITFLVSDFLDLGQLRADKFRRSDRVFRINEPFDEVLSILQFKAAHKHIEVNTNYEDIGSDTLVNCDSLRVT